MILVAPESTRAYTKKNQEISVVLRDIRRYTKFL